MCRDETAGKDSFNARPIHIRKNTQMTESEGSGMWLNGMPRSPT